MEVYKIHILIKNINLLKTKYLIELNVLQVPPYDPSNNLIAEGIPGKGETPIEKLLEGVFAVW